MVEQLAKEDSQNRRSPGGRACAWVGIAANINSGLGQGRKRVERLMSALDERGFEPRVAWTPQERQALVQVARSEPNCRCLVAAGGDGTVAALVNDCPDVPITVLRAGTENLFAGHFGLSSRPERLAAMIADGPVAELDVGRTGERRFTLMAGVGFDADVVTRHHVARVGHAGVARPTHRAMYVEPVLRSSFAYRFPPLQITIHDPGHEEQLIGTTAFLFNLPRYALGLPFAPTARGDDGWLDLVLFRNPGAFHALRYLWLVLRGLHLKRPGVYHRRVARVSIAAAEDVPVQLDGDPGGMIAATDSGAAWTAEILPRALKVIVPAAYAASHTG